MASIKKILAVDKKYRVVGVTGDLYTMDKLVSDLTLDYDTPTLCGKNTDKPNVLINSKTEFIKKFNEQHPCLKNINMKNLLIAGGSVSNIVRNKYDRSSDVDFFIYGLNQNKATARIKEWLLDIIIPKKSDDNKKNKNRNDDNELSDCDDDSESSDKPKKGKKEYKIGDYKIIKNNNSIAILMEDEIKIQLIFRLYKSISEILHGFDLGSSAVGYDGDDIYFTSLGKFCHEHSCNIIDTTRRSTTYEYRLSKYFDRGFNIVLPKLDISKLKTNYFKYNEVEICELPYFIFGYSNIIGNKIIINKFYNKFGNNSDYDLEPMDPMNVYYQSLKINIINLINDIEYFYYVSSHIDEDNIDILNKPPRLNKGNIISFYDDIRSKLNNKNIDVNLIKKYITGDTVENIVSNMFNKEIDTKIYFNELIEKQKKSALRKLDKLLAKDHSKINWIIENPGTQLTSSFNPIIEDESEWYGKKYYKTK
jgi:hypothetical protein